MIRIGVAGWDYPDWAGVVYPSPAPRRFDRLRYLAGFLDILEINVTFYRPIEPRTSQAWAGRIESPGFLFTAKLHQSFTHSGVAGVPSASAEDLAVEARRFLDAMAPLVRAGRLGAVLMQFPQGFHRDPDALRHIERLAGLLPGLPLVAEFRHRSWDDPAALWALKRLGIGFCNIDQPALGSTLPPTAHVTSPIAYVRLHGRNARQWFTRDARPGEGTASRGGGSGRYDYLYSLDELRPWVERIRDLAERAEEVFVVANNHYRGKAPANALMLKGLLSGRRVAAPADLHAAIPALAEVADPVAPVRRRPQQGRLF